jgi:membrane protein
VSIAAILARAPAAAARRRGFARTTAGHGAGMSTSHGTGFDRQASQAGDRDDTTPDVVKPPMPQPEPTEARVREAGVRDLSWKDRFAILVRAVKESMDDNIPALAAALAYSFFLAIPAILIVTLGVWGLFADASSVTRLLQDLEGVIPAEAIALLETPMRNIATNQSGNLVMVGVGFAIALWSITGAMGTLMWALNVAYERGETRNFFKKRITGLGMFGCLLLAIALVAVLLILGPFLSDWVGEQLGMESVVSWIWWTAQWPLLVAGLLIAFAGVYYLGPNVDHPRWTVLSVGSVIALVVWLAASAAFAFYASNFGSYNKTWGFLSIVIVMLTWLWLSSLALLFGAEVNAETERSRELREGQPAEEELQAPAKA